MTDNDGRMSTSPTPYMVHCPNHGPVYLTTLEYERQMWQAGSLWKCPECHRTATWDDENYERRMASIDEA
jgi:hypothetical protein